MTKEHDELVDLFWATDVHLIEALHEVIDDIVHSFDLALRGHRVEDREAILKVVKDYVSREYGD